MAKFHSIIPARLASSRLPEKPLKLIGGLPMVVRVAERAKESGAETIVVATDSERIVEACEKFYVTAILTSPEHSTGTDRLSEAVRILNLSDDDIVVNVQGDEPLIPPAVIREVAELLANNPECQMATAAHEIHDIEEFLNPNVVKVVLNQHQEAVLFSRAPIPWPRDSFRKNPTQLPNDLHPLRHIGLYAYRVSFLKQFPTWPMATIEKMESLEQLRALWYGVKIIVKILPHALPSGVDTPEDLERVRQHFEASHT